MLTVVGEFNSGKSSFINALLGKKVCRTGILPTTDHIHILMHTDGQEQINGNQYDPLDIDPASASSSSSSSSPLPSSSSSSPIVTESLSLPVLRDYSLVDTPGTNAITAVHQLITEEFLPRSDLILFVTSCDRPFSQSEVDFIHKIQKWKKRVVFVLNKMDTMTEKEDRVRVVEFVKENARKVMRATTPAQIQVQVQAETEGEGGGGISAGNEAADDDTIRVFPVSSQRAFAAKSMGGPCMASELDQSGFAALEHYIFSSLSIVSKVRIKLESPLGIIDKILTPYIANVVEREKSLQADERLVQQLNQLLHEYEKEMKQDYEYQIHKIHKLFESRRKRSEIRIGEVLQLKNVLSLLRSGSRDRMRVEYDQMVNGGVETEIHETISQLIDWMADKGNKTQQQMQTLLQLRLATLKQQQYRTNDSLPTSHTTSDASSSSTTTSTATPASLANGFPSSSASSVPPPSAYAPSHHSALLALQHQVGGIVNQRHRDTDTQLLSDTVSRALTTLLTVEGTSAAVLASLLSGVLALQATLVLPAVGGVAATGLLYTLPYCRRSLVAQLMKRNEEQQMEVVTILNKYFDQQVEQHHRRLKELIHPYVRWVKQEETAIEEVKETLREVKQEVEHIRQAIRKVK